MTYNFFKELNAVNVNEKTETIKNNFGTKLTYLSWAWAVTEITKLYPDFIYEIERFANNLPYVYDEKTGYMVFTKVTIEGITKEMWLPVMDSNNKAMLDHPYEYQTRTGKRTVDAATMFDINKTIMRCLTKNISMFGLGLYIYAGEDLPEDGSTEPKQPSFVVEDKPDNVCVKSSVTANSVKTGKLIEESEGEDISYNEAMGHKPSVMAYEPTDEIKFEIKKCAIDVSKLAVYLKKDVKDLTEEDYRNAIQTKKNIVEKKNAADKEKEHAGA